MSLWHSVLTGILPLSFLLPERAWGAVFSGDGLQGGVDEADVADLASSGDLKTVVINIVNTVLNFLGLIAVITVIIAGIYLIVSLGNDEGKEKAKKIILYTLVGLVIVLFAKVIVAFVASEIASTVGA